MGQFLTAVFELDVTKRKAAALERVRQSAEVAFWSIMQVSKEHAEGIAAILDKKERTQALAHFTQSVTKSIASAGIKTGLNEPVIMGVSRDACGCIASYVELKAGGYAAEWPQRGQEHAHNIGKALDDMATSSTKEQENAARDMITIVSRGNLPRPFTLARSRDGLIVRDAPDGRIAVILKVIPVTPSSQVTTIKAGFDASTGEILPSGKSKAKLAVPLKCSKWHEQKFLSGRARLCSSQISRDGARWFMYAQFEMATKKACLTGNKLGVDRGIVNPISMAVVDKSGAVLRVSEPLGADIGASIHKADERRRAEQKRRGATSHKHEDQINHRLHELANEIVREAKIHGATVVFEKLDGLKAVISVKRAHGARRNPWQKSLKKAQLGKLETIVTYKLKLAGLPPIVEVVAGGTSQTCPACGVRDKKNRTEQATFQCVSCGFANHADVVAPVNIGRRAIVLKKIKKGDKLAPLEQNMVTQLRLRGDSGLGPLAAAYSGASGLVADRVSASGAYEVNLSTLTPMAGQNVIPNAQNEVPFVFPLGSTTITRHVSKILAGKSDG